MSTIAEVPPRTVAASRPATKTPQEDGESVLYRFSVSQYHEMVSKGLIEEGEAVELLEGLVVSHLTKGRRHVIAAALLRAVLERLIGNRWHIEVQDPVTTAESEPEPDLVVVRGLVTDYEQHPVAADIPLVIEVAETSLVRDQGLKKRIYARAGFAAYWIVNLVDRQIEVYTQPDSQAAEPDYRERRDYRENDQVPVMVDGVELGNLLVREILPRPEDAASPS